MHFQKGEKDRIRCEQLQILALTCVISLRLLDIKKNNFNMKPSDVQKALNQIDDYAVSDFLKQGYNKAERLLSSTFCYLTHPDKPEIVIHLSFDKQNEWFMGVTIDDFFVDEINSILQDKTLFAYHYSLNENFGSNYPDVETIKSLKSLIYFLESKGVPLHYKRTL